MGKANYIHVNLPGAHGKQAALEAAARIAVSQMPDTVVWAERGDHEPCANCRKKLTGHGDCVISDAKYFCHQCYKQQIFVRRVINSADQIGLDRRWE